MRKGNYARMQELLLRKEEQGELNEADDKKLKEQMRLVSCRR